MSDFRAENGGRIVQVNSLRYPRREAGRRYLPAETHPGAGRRQTTHRLPGIEAKRSPRIRAELAPGGELIAGYVGRLATEKRVDLLAGITTLDGVRLVIRAG
jgi:glycosyltransferase involved in cell wall biosynthesis